MLYAERAAYVAGASGGDSDQVSEQADELGRENELHRRVPDLAWHDKSRQCSYQRGAHAASETHGREPSSHADVG